MVIHGIAEIGGMRAIPEYLAKNLKVELGKTVRTLSKKDSKWMLETFDGSKYSAKTVVLTPPIPYSLALLDKGNIAIAAEYRKKLDSVKYIPCIAVMAILNGSSGLTEWGGLRITGTFIDWIADNTLKGVSPDVNAVTIQAMPDFSRNFWDHDDDEVARMLIDNAKALLVFRCHKL